MQYCEGIENGFLFVFKDFDAFKFRGAPIQKEMLTEIPAPLMEKMEFFKSFFIPQHKFPSEGIEIEIKVVTGDPSQIMPVAKNFILSVDPDIIISYPDSKTLVMKVPRYEIIQNYVNSLVRRFYLSLT